MSIKSGTWTAQIAIHSNAYTDGIFSKMPSAATFLFGSTRHIAKVDVTGMTYVRLKVNKQGTSGYAGSTLSLCYSPTYSTNVSDYIDLGVTPVSVAVDTTNAYLDSDWVLIDPSALANEDVFLAVIGQGGNGNAGPAFGNISASFC